MLARRRHAADFPEPKKEPDEKDERQNDEEVRHEALAIRCWCDCLPLHPYARGGCGGYRSAALRVKGVLQQGLRPCRALYIYAA